MNKKLTYLIVLSFLFLFTSSSVVFGDDFQDGWDAYQKKDYKEAVKWWLPLAEQGHAKAQNNLGSMYEKGQGVLQDYSLAHMWWNICFASGIKVCVKNRNIIENRMSKQQIEEAQRLARNWKPTSK